MDDGGPDEALVDTLRTQLLAVEGLSVLSHVDMLLMEHQSVLNDLLTNDILSAISNIKDDMLGKDPSTLLYDWETEHKPLHDFLQQQIQYVLKVVERWDNTRLSQTEAERLATVWRVVQRYPYVTWGVTSIVYSFEETVQQYLQNLLDSDDVQGCMDALKLVKPLPTEVMEPKLSSILKKLASHTKNHDPQIVDAAKSALVSCLEEEEFGIKYLQVVIQSLQETEEHELVNSVLSSCLDNLFAWVESGMYEDAAAEQKNKRMKEYTFDSLRVIAENVTLKSQALELVSLVTSKLKELSNEKARSFLEEILQYISAGFANNTSYVQEDLFDLIYSLLRDDGIGDEISLPVMIAGFALDLLLKRLKKKELEELNQEEWLDPFVGLMIGCLRNQWISSAALTVLHFLLSSPLPSLNPGGDRYEGDRMLTEVVKIAKSGRRNEEISLICKEILVEFLLKDSLSDASLFKHIENLLDKRGSDNQTIDIVYVIIKGLVDSGRRKFLNKHCRKLFVSFLSVMPAKVDYRQSRSGDLVKYLVDNIDRDHSGSLLAICLASFKERPGPVAKVMGFFRVIFCRSFGKHFRTILKVMEQADTAFQKYCALLMVEEVLTAFSYIPSRDEFEDTWKKVFGALLQRDARFRSIRLELLKKYSEGVKKHSKEVKKKHSGSKTEISKELNQLKAEVEDMTRGNSGKRRLEEEEEQERNVPRKKRK